MACVEPSGRPCIVRWERENLIQKKSSSTSMSVEQWLCWLRPVPFSRISNGIQMGDVNWGGKIKTFIGKVQRATSCLMIVSIPAHTHQWKRNGNKWFYWEWSCTLADWLLCRAQVHTVTSIQCTSPAVLYTMIYISIYRFTLHELW